ncbi:MAG: hypothetical protein AAB880_01445, partial [Patescibacteria group bacterium]
MEKYIPLSEIANLTPYKADYLALLAGRGRLKAVQKDGVWYSTMEWVNEYVVWLNNQMETMQASFELRVPSYKTEESKLASVMLEGAPATDSIHLKTKMDAIVPQDAGLQNDVKPQLSRNPELETHNFLSLQEAAKVSPYSADYISLRIRQGKIQATKRGGKWFTKLSWINEYVAEHGAKVDAGVAELQNGRIEVKENIVPVENAKIQITNAKANPKFKIQNPFDLKSFGLHLKFDSLKFGISSRIKSCKQLFSSKSFQRATAGSLIALLLVFTLSQDSVRASFYDWSSQAVKSISVAAQEVSGVISSSVSKVAANVKYQSSNIKANLNDKVQNLALNIKSFDLDLSFDSLAFDINIPSFSLPDIQLPKLALPDISLPSVSMPDLSLPKLALPNINLPDLSPIKNTIIATIDDLSLRVKRSNLTGAWDKLFNKGLVQFNDKIAAVVGTLPRNDREDISGVVLGESTASPLAPASPSRSFSVGWSNILSPLKSSFSFLNPSDSSSLLSRLSGSAIEIGSSISESTKYGLNSITTFSSNLNLSKILQPANSFMARVFPTPRTYSGQAIG